MRTERGGRLALAIIAAMLIAACTTILGDDFVVETTLEPGVGGVGGTSASGGGGSASVCGDGEIEAAEGCDDGNQDSGDGCADDCTVEGTCEAPVAMPEAQNNDTTVGWKVEAKTGGVDQVGVATPT